jgi:hypothetical protein
MGQEVPRNINHYQGDEYRPHSFPGNLIQWCFHLFIPFLIGLGQFVLAEEFRELDSGHDYHRYQVQLALPCPIPYLGYDCPDLLITHKGIGGDNTQLLLSRID